jgi:hypothetical protein
MQSDQDLPREARCGVLESALAGRVRGRAGSIREWRMTGGRRPGSGPVPLP